jgi:hypothetical protein
VHNLRESQKPAKGAVTVEELEHAETSWLREIQKSIVGSDKFGQIKNSLDCLLMIQEFIDARDD